MGNGGTTTSKKNILILIVQIMSCYIVFGANFMWNELKIHHNEISSQSYSQNTNRDGAMYITLPSACPLHGRGSIMGMTRWRPTVGDADPNDATV